MTSRSVWQSPLARSRTRTSRGRSAPTVTSSRVSGCPTPWRTAARNVAALPEPFSRGPAVEDLALALHDRRVARQRVGGEIARGRLLGLEVPILVDAADEERAVAGAGDLAHAGRQVADGE